MLKTLAHTLEIGDHVAYWHAGQPRTGVIRYFSDPLQSGHRQRIFIKDDITKEMRAAPANLVNYQPLEETA